VDSGLSLFNPEPEQAPEGEIEDVVEPDLDDAERSPALRCAACGFRVTRQAWRLAMEGRSSRVFFNPAGLIFELGCFSAAPGCACVGQPSQEFCWFPGYAWRVALCRNCATHLGWRYEGPADAFFGLILDALLDEAPPGEQAR